MIKKKLNKINFGIYSTKFNPFNLEVGYTRNSDIFIYKVY